MARRGERPCASPGGGRRQRSRSGRSQPARQEQLPQPLGVAAALAHQEQLVAALHLARTTLTKGSKILTAAGVLPARPCPAPASPMYSEAHRERRLAAEGQLHRVHLRRAPSRRLPSAAGGSRCVLHQPPRARAVPGPAAARPRRAVRSASQAARTASGSSSTTTVSAGTQVVEHRLMAVIERGPQGLDAEEIVPGAESPRSPSAGVGSECRGCSP